MILTKSHYFQFTPKNNGEGIYEFAKNSDLLYDPEDIGFDIFKMLIAGLEEEDCIRLKLSVFADVVIGEIITIIPSQGEELPEEYSKRNKKALERAEAFIKSLYDAGFTDDKAVIIKGFSPLA